MIIIEEKTADLFREKYGIAPEATKRLFRDNVLSETYCKRVLIADEFVKRQREGITKTEIKILLSERYAISYSMVEKYIKFMLNGDSDT